MQEQDKPTFLSYVLISILIGIGLDIYAFITAFVSACFLLFDCNPIGAIVSLRKYLNERFTDGQQ